MCARADEAKNASGGAGNSIFAKRKRVVRAASVGDAVRFRLYFSVVCRLFFPRERKQTKKKRKNEKTNKTHVGIQEKDEGEGGKKCADARNDITI